MADLQVVYPKPWIAEEFNKAGITTQTYSIFDAVKQTGPIWWSTEMAARSRASGPEIYLTAPNYEDFVNLPKNLLKRNVWAMELGNLKRDYHVGMKQFVKPADSKIVGPGDIGKAMVVDDVSKWAKDCLAYGVPWHTMCIVSEPIEIEEEWRIWTDGESILEASKYRSWENTWDEWPKELLSYGPLKFADQAVKAVGQPCTIDIGYKDGVCFIIEMNPIWSSGPYTSDFAQIYKGIKASYDWAKKGKGRAWKPDAWLKAKTAKWTEAEQKKLNETNS